MPGIRRPLLLSIAFLAASSRAVERGIEDGEGVAPGERAPLSTHETDGYTKVHRTSHVNGRTSQLDLEDSRLYEDQKGPISTYKFEKYSKRKIVDLVPVIEWIQKRGRRHLDAEEEQQQDDDDEEAVSNRLCSEYLVSFLEGSTDAKDTCEGISNAFTAAGAWDSKNILLSGLGRQRRYGYPHNEY